MKISQFPLIESVDGSEQLAIVKDGANGKMKTSAIIAKAKEGLVPQIAGKGLSTNDYTNADKTKLDALPIKAELDTSLASKQPAITPSDDIAPLGSDKLALTDKAKMAELIAEAKINGAVYNDKTGFFELNTLTDITAPQMRTILNFGRFHFTDPMAGAYSANRNINSMIRTNILVASLDELNLYSTANGLCYGQGLLEVLVVGLGPQYDQTWTMRPKSIFTTLTRCRKLHTIIGDIRLDRLEKANEQAFISCDELRNVCLRDIVKSLDISGAPLLSFDSVAFMVDNAKNTEAISIKVHPDVYAKLTGDTTNAAAAALSADELAQWQALVATAGAKQITFATT